MGAFGELLIKSWGGNLNSYRGDSNQVNRIEETSKEIEDFSFKQTYHDRKEVMRIIDKIRYGYLNINDIDQSYFTDSKDYSYFLNYKEKYYK